jgi:hypothetical protein
MEKKETFTMRMRSERETYLHTVLCAPKHNSVATAIRQKLAPQTGREPGIRSTSPSNLRNNVIGREAAAMSPSKRMIRYESNRLRKEGFFLSF